MMNRKIIIKIESLHSSCPSQWRLYTYQGEILYVRYRWGILLIQDEDNVTIYSKKYGSASDGYMTTLAMINQLKILLDFSKYLHN
jgi:hypothetical protein